MDEKSSDGFPEWLKSRSASLRVLVTGAGGYIGLRLVHALLEAGFEVVACVRDRRRFPEDDFEASASRLCVIESDFLKPETLGDLGRRIDLAYYLVHSLSASGDRLDETEFAAAENFTRWSDANRFGRLAYLGALGDETSGLSPHLRSRRRVEGVLRSGCAPVTVLRASIIVGSGSASFEIIRDLVEKLPVMIAPRWLNSRCQPVAIGAVIRALTGLPCLEETAGKTYDIGGPQILRYRDLLDGYAKVRGLPRRIITVPALTPRLSSLWLALVTAVNLELARRLVDSLCNETVCRPEASLPGRLYEPISYEEAVRRAFSKIAQNRVPSSWYGALSSGRMSDMQLRTVKVPQHGVLRDRRSVALGASREEVLARLWGIGGEAGWPSMNAAWRLRGFVDRCCGGCGMRRGRRHPSELRPGDALDFWRVLQADKGAGRLILLAEMRAPGEAWLDFEISKGLLVQTATFRPRGWTGRLYWWLMWPAHAFLFPAMARRLASGAASA